MAKSQNSIFKRNFNWLGYIYNPLKRLFLWNRPEVVIAQSILEINQQANALIVGGGADNTVEELLKQEKPIDITHLDISSVLSEKAKKRIIHIELGMNQVQFQVIPFLDFKPNDKYDVIIFPFYLDLYSEYDVMKNIEHAKSLLTKDGMAYVIDFSSNQEQTIWMRFKVMFLYIAFFPIIHTPRITIPSYDDLFTMAGYCKSFECRYYDGFYSLKAFKKDF